MKYCSARRMRHVNLQNSAVTKKIHNGFHSGVHLLHLPNARFLHMSAMFKTSRETFDLAIKCNKCSWTCGSTSRISSFSSRVNSVEFDHSPRIGCPNIAMSIPAWENVLFSGTISWEIIGDESKISTAPPPKKKVPTENESTSPQKSPKNWMFPTKTCIKITPDFCPPPR